MVWRPVWVREVAEDREQWSSLARVVFWHLNMTAGIARLVLGGEVWL